MKINGSVVWLTGGTAGIGKGVAKLLLEEGACVAITGRNKERGEAAAAELGGNCIYVQQDVTDTESNFAAAKTIVDKWGRIDILCNFGGVTHPQPLFDANGELTSIEPYLTDINIDLIGTLDVARIAAYYMKNNEPDEKGERGNLVLCSSLAGDSLSGNFLFGYKPAKEGVRGLTRCFANALAPYGIRCNTVMPGTIRSNMTMDKNSLGYVDPEKDVPMNLFPKYIGEPEHIASAVKLLVENDYINRADINVDAGAIIRY